MTKILKRLACIRSSVVHIEKDTTDIDSESKEEQSLPSKSQCSPLPHDNFGCDRILANSRPDE